MAEVGKGKIPEAHGKPLLKQMTMQKLYEDKPLFSKVISMLDSRKSYEFISSFLANQGYNWSKASISKFNARIREARDTGLTFDEVFLDKRGKQTIDKVDPSRVTGYVGVGGVPTKKKNYHGTQGGAVMHVRSTKTQAVSDNQALDHELTEQEKKQALDPNTKFGGVVQNMAQKKLWSTGQVLESIIDKGVASLDSIQYLDIPILLKAIEMYDKSHSDTHGLSMSALAQYKALMDAKTTAMGQILAQYVPEDKQAEALNALSKAEAEFMKDLDMSESGSNFMKALKDSGMDF